MTPNKHGEVAVRAFTLFVDDPSAAMCDGVRSGISDISPVYWSRRGHGNTAVGHNQDTGHLARAAPDALAKTRRKGLDNDFSHGLPCPHQNEV